MNIVLTIAVIVVIWSSLSILVALTVGAMAKPRDAGAGPLLDRNLVQNDERVRPAV